MLRAERTLRWSGTGGWSCGLRSWNAGWARTARTPGRRRRRRASGRRRGARPGGGRNPSGSGARTASGAGSPGTRGKGLVREPDPDEKKDADRPAECRCCKAPLDGAEAVGRGGRRSSTYGSHPDGDRMALPGLVCACCGTVTFAEPPAGAHAGSVSYGAVLNAAAVVLTATGTCRPSGPRRSSAMLLGVAVSAGLGGQGQRPAGGAAGQGRVRRCDARGAGRRGRAGRGRDPGERAGQERPAARRAGRRRKNRTRRRRRRRLRVPRTC